MVKEEEFLSSGLVEDLEVDYYLYEFGSYYFVSLCSKFQDRMVKFRSVLVGIE